MERQDEDLSIMLEKKEAKIKKQDEKPKSQNKKHKYGVSRQQSPTKFLIPIQNAVEEEPEEIIMLREKKLQEESTRKGSEATSCAGLSKSRQGAIVFETKYEYKPENHS